MLFNVDHDDGQAISGWLVLDNPGEPPFFRFTVPGRQDHLFKANVFRKDLFDLGMHTTGMAGFLIDQEMIPGLAEINNFVLREAATGLPIYSRYDPDIHIGQKLLMIDTGVLPQIRTMQRMMKRFTMRYPLVDRYSLETGGWLFSRPYFRSACITGNINWMRMSSAVEASGFLSVALLRDPFEELAEKFVLLKRLIDQPTNVVAAPILERYELLLPIVQDMNMSNSRSILAAMRKLSREQRRLLRSPMTYAFGATPDEELQRRNVSVALDNLARFSVVGVRNRFNEFASLVDALVGTTVLSDMELQKLPDTDELALMLADIGTVCDLVDEDIALYSFANEAVSSAFDAHPDLIARIGSVGEGR